MQIRKANWTAHRQPLYDSSGCARSCDCCAAKPHWNHVCFNNNSNNQPYLVRVTLNSWDDNLWPSFPDRIGIWSIGFGRGSKTGEPGEKPSEQGREPTTKSSHMWRDERGALSPLRHRCISQFCIRNWRHIFIAFRFNKWLRVVLYAGCCLLQILINSVCYFFAAVETNENSALLLRWLVTLQLYFWWVNCLPLNLLFQSI